MSTPVRRGIYGKLAGDTTLNTLLATPPAGWTKSIYYQIAPAKAPYPFVLLNKQAGTPREAFGDPSALETDVWMVKAIGMDTPTQSSADAVEAISARVTSLLNDAALSISGSTTLYVRRQSDVDYLEVTDGVQYRHSGSLYRLVTD